jgi:tripartite-type tricarboxylate transporter receptor subunit TctC
MRLARRKFLRVVGGAVAAPAFSRIARAQTYPTRPITIIVPFAPGGTTDMMSRVLAERMRQSLGRPLIIENVSGADGTIGAARAAHARPDGYEIDVGFPTNHALSADLYSLQYGMNDFAPISPLTKVTASLFGRKTLPAKDFKELIAWLKATLTKVSVGSISITTRLLIAAFQKETGAQLTIVPYRGAAPARQDLVASQIDLLFDAPDALTLVRAGTIKAYAVDSDTRRALAPDIPTFAEMGLPNVSYHSWYGLFAPSGTPKEIIGKLNTAAAEALADPIVRSRLTELGLQIFPREQHTPEALGALVKEAAEKWSPIIKELGIKAE